MCNINSRDYVFMEGGKCSGLYDDLLEKGIQPVADLPLFDLEEGFFGGVYVYKKTEELKKAIADIVIEQKLWGWDEPDEEPVETIDYSQLVY